MFKITFKKSILVSLFSFAAIAAAPNTLAGSLSPTAKSGHQLTTTTSDPSLMLTLIDCEVNLCFNNPEGGCNGEGDNYEIIQTTAEFCQSRGGTVLNEDGTGGSGDNDDLPLQLW